MRLSSFRFSDQDQIEGTNARVDRNQERREQRIRLAMKTWPEIPRTRLRFERHLIVDEATNEVFTIVRGEVDVPYTPIVAFYLAEDGSAVFLERVAGARTADELEAKRAEREQARAERMKPRARQ